jgi:magnesium-transporting ATPase (P-type)
MIVLVKGADTSMLRLSHHRMNEEIESKSEMYASMGLRTLVFGLKKIS